MKKVGLTRSIHLKFVMIYVLLILLAMQIIGVYFVRSLEERFVNNFKTSIQNRVEILQYTVKEEMLKTRTDTDPKLEDDLNRILRDSRTNDISEIRVINSKSRVIGTSGQNEQNLIGQAAGEKEVKRALALGINHNDIYFDKKSGDRIWVFTEPIESNNEVIGAMFVVGQIETVYDQMNEINAIFTRGTIIALVITAILGVLLAQTITRPISDMRKQALAMSKGNFSRKVKVYGYDEIGQLAITFNNLTKRLQDSQASTEGERRKLSSVLSYMTDGVIATDRKGRVILINDPAANMLNVSRETVVSQPIVSLLGIEEEYSFEDLSNTQDSIILDYSTNEKPYILRANFSIIQKETGFVNGLITVLHDITEQEKIDLERREFVANVSHELRTPLTTMRSYLEALAEGAWQDENIAPRFLDVTQNETERMIRLVNDLLQLSKMDSKDYRFNRDWMDFIGFFHKIIDRFEMSKNQDVRFVRILPDQAMFVEIDQDKITQVLDNIISNALKYSPEGGTITFIVEEKNGFIEISISDQGLGIPKDNLGKIFERFYRVDKARTRQMGGTGLGLAIAKEMITAHGGDIWADSVEGKGTTITFTLPYDALQEDDWS
ncbi:cell wall metabolism sensor histidine kinase WalK [Rossellomorea marisflavi]|uniref:histidine kinase n=1 Tax=Rossellomorea marisflavi TaxID=189381 RepID=A0A5D4RP51_9BACI|nr:cell wall metabolism sensor histidine kinase WalK [Rossellomorea marisflavi]KQU58739.1 PAS domain-containing sensor histidine kinase [Bacillus sp. Leaf406]MBV6684756.1 cell wall metabolism sensor histidine kinase WalK [Bacillus sp. JRC01]MDW4528798.1 cell wall metabolism sensor histidine kinase WalK [Rossellomorea marisflavi]TYS51576.1 cell wall metabolism sensor histidine kinase WalK [Rossellomorea marisflavi]UKS65332.1 cell wall metabolism sensor histidine kinase WalK [Rossellomorea maris